MTATPLPRILCVDDEPHVLAGLQRTLHGRYEVETREGGAAAIQLLDTDRAFCAVVCDLRMPGPDGVSVLKHVRAVAPDTARILLTGRADMQSAIRAVNESALFGFLQKPCPPDMVDATLRRAVEHHHRRTAERGVLEQTLHGAVRALINVLAVTSPTAFGRATRVQHVMTELMRVADIAPSWEEQVAALVVHLGCVALPASTLEKLCHDHDLDAIEQSQVQRLPDLASRLIADIPRLEGVREILAHAHRRYDGHGAPPEEAKGDDIPRGARFLKVAMDFVGLSHARKGPEEAVRRMLTREGRYDPLALRCLALAEGVLAEPVIRHLRLRDVDLGMVFTEDVRRPDGTLLLARGQEATPALLDVMRHYWDNDLLEELVQVTVPDRRPTNQPDSPATPGTVDNAAAIA